MQFSQSFLGGIKKFLYSLERYFHIVLKTNLNISFSTTQIVVIAKRLESEVISRYLYTVKVCLKLGDFWVNFGHFCVFILVFTVFNKFAARGVIIDASKPVHQLYHYV